MSDQDLEDSHDPTYDFRRDLVRHNIKDVTADQLARICSAMSSLARVFPRVSNSSKTLLDAWYHNNYQCDLSRDPLLHYGYQQVCLWCQDVYHKIAEFKLVHYDIQDMFISLWELHVLMIERSPLVAQQFGGLIRKISIYLAEVGAHLSKLGGLQPVDYLQIGDITYYNSTHVVEQRESIKPVIYSLPAVRAFRAQRLLGAGAFGAVYKAVYTPANMIFTVKLVSADVFSCVEHVITDRVVASILNHPHVVSYYAVFSVREGAVTVMEYLKAVDLQKVVERAKCFRVEQCRLVFAQLVAAVMHMHYCGVMHRDIKGSNALMLKGGRVKLIDFDTNRVCMGHFPIRIIPAYFHRTAAELDDREKAGTLPYMAPEVLTSSAYGRAMDWWSMGVTLYKFLVGRCPFRGVDEATLTRQICHESFAFPKSKPNRSDYLEPAMGIIRSLLTRNSTMRLGSVDYAEILTHPFLATVDWDWLANTDVVANFRAFNAVMVEASCGRTYREIPDNVVDKYSPEASMNTKCRQLMRLDHCTDKTHHQPLLTYMSASFREIMTTGAIQSSNADIPIIKTLVIGAPSAVLEYNSTKKVDPVLAERLDIAVVCEESPTMLGLRLDPVLSEDGSIYYIVSDISQGSAADNSSLVEGDIVFSINGSTVVGLSMSAVDDLLASVDSETIFSVLTSGTFRMFNSRWDFRNIIRSLKQKDVELRPLSPKIPEHTVDEISVKQSAYYDSEHKCYIKENLILNIPSEASGDVFSGDIILALNDTPSKKFSQEELQTKLNEIGSKKTVSILPISGLRSNRSHFTRLLEAYDSNQKPIFEDTILSS